MKNENGFTYPLTLTLLTLFLIVLTINADLLITERKMLQEITAVWKAEYYMLSAVKKAEKELERTGSLAESRLMVLENGKVECSLESNSVNPKKVNFLVTLDSGHTFTGIAYYDNNLKKMIRWIEKN